MSARSEVMRKLVHAGFGMVALTLGWLTTFQAALLALFAFLFNWLLLPRMLGRWISRDSERSDAGILIYPLAVLGLILFFHDSPALAAACWSILAFGDGAATLVGRHVPIRRLSWNADKSAGGIAGFIIVATPLAYLIANFVAVTEGTRVPLFVIAIAVVVSAMVESARTAIDDNITVPVAALLAVLAGSHAATPHFEPLVFATAVWLGANAILAVFGYLTRSVDLSGMIGGWTLGTVMIVCAGWQLYLVLILFFVLGTSATKLGYARKADLGIAQEKSGRRGLSHAFANAGVAALLALLIPLTDFPAGLLFLGAVAALATAAADTCGSEIGQWLGRRAFLPLTFSPVPPGTEGAVSVEGTAASLLAAVVVAAAGVVVAPFEIAARPLTATLVVALAAFAGAYLEGVIGSWRAKRGRAIPNGVLNFINTLTGALLAIVGLVLLG